MTWTSACNLNCSITWYYSHLCFFYSCHSLFFSSGHLSLPPSINSSFFFLCPSRPGVLKDLKTMGSISLFIFFITLLVLARQVSPHCNSLNDVIIWRLHIFPLKALKRHHCTLCFPVCLCRHWLNSIVRSTFYIFYAHVSRWGITQHCVVRVDTIESWCPVQLIMKLPDQSGHLSSFRCFLWMQRKLDFWCAVGLWYLQAGRCRDQSFISVLLGVNATLQGTRCTWVGLSPQY